MLKLAEKMLNTMWNVAAAQEGTARALQGQSVEKHRPLLDTALLQAGRLEEEGSGRGGNEQEGIEPIT